LGLENSVDMKKQTTFKRPFILLALTAISIFICVSGCGRKDKSPEEEMIVLGQPEYYQENDTLSIKPIPENLGMWINYYQQFDTAFNIRNFTASGVTVHLNELEDATTGDVSLMEGFFPLLSFSPDSSQFIDFWSYNQMIETNKAGERIVIGGDPDQEVAWVNKKTGTKKQLMYNGPQQIVETADWINNQSMLLGMINVNETNTEWSPEILLFNFADSTFTNFRLRKNLAVEKMVTENADFASFWLKKKNYKRG
jgi:hypothetical protein